MPTQDNDNHSDQLNPTSDAYWQSRGWEDRPEDWEDRIKTGDTLLPDATKDE
ncbi:MAG: hypothetical protein WD294_02270 [Phycisphaeraceae bacterium]